MFKRILVKRIASSFEIPKRTLKDIKNGFKKVLVLNKRTRYEIEKYLNPETDDYELEKRMRRRGSDFDTIIRHHSLHKKFFNNLIESLTEYDINLQTVSRTQFNEEAVEWADLILVAGGDGTFLLGASKVKNNEKTIIGFNSDPSRSQGHLCLPKQFSLNIGEALSKIFQNEFNWLLRSRIEVLLKGCRAGEDPVHLDDCTAPRYEKLMDQVFRCYGSEDDKITEKVVPFLALNEVFIGEVVSSQVSYLEVEKGDCSGKTAGVKVKCSGMCVATGTGSTSWHLSINRLSESKVSDLLRLAGVNHPEPSLIARKYNDSLTFKPEEPWMYYSFRDLIRGDVWPDPEGVMKGGLVESLHVRSKCFNAALVIDGGAAYSFNDGTAATLSINPETALRSVILK